jgi:hypothetical protein
MLTEIFKDKTQFKVQFCFKNCYADSEFQNFGFGTEDALFINYFTTV